MTSLQTLVNRITTAEWVAGASDRLGDTVAHAIPNGMVKNALSGAWLGHPLHPVLTDIPIGSFTSATVLDLIGGDQGRRSADVLVALGVMSAVPTALAGAADWSDTSGENRSLGLVHAACNAIGVSLYAISLAPRRHGHRSLGTLLGLAGMSVMTVGGYIGGHMIFTRGVGCAAAMGLAVNRPHVG